MQTTVVQNNARGLQSVFSYNGLRTKEHIKGEEQCFSELF